MAKRDDSRRDRLAGSAADEGSPEEYAGFPGFGESPEWTAQSHPDPDEQITEKIRERLNGNVQVTWHDGEVTLRGTVESEQDKRWAAEIASQVDGVSQVHNELQVRY